MLKDGFDDWEAMMYPYQDRRFEKVMRRDVLRRTFDNIRMLRKTKIVGLESRFGIGEHHRESDIKGRHETIDTQIFDPLYLRPASCGSWLVPDFEVGP